MQSYSFDPIGVIRSELRKVEDAPPFYTEGAPDAFLEIAPEYADGLHRMRAGDEIIVITWLHLAGRDILKVHPRGDESNPVTGVFLTRSPDRPNPLGLHRATVLGVEGRRVHVGAMEAIDGTPVVDIKVAVDEECRESALADRGDRDPWRFSLPSGTRRSSGSGRSFRSAARTFS